MAIAQLSLMVPGESLGQQNVCFARNWLGALLSIQIDQAIRQLVRKSTRLVT
jgi:hypothetical protein